MNKASHSKGIQNAMSDNSRTVARIKAKLLRFSGIISKDFSKAKKKLIKELLYGIQASKDVKLSNVSHLTVPYF